MKRALIILLAVFMVAGSGAGAAPAKKPMAEIINSGIHMTGLMSAYEVKGDVLNKTLDTIQVTLRVIVYDKHRNILGSSLISTDPVFLRQGQTGRFRI